MCIMRIYLLLAFMLLFSSVQAQKNIQKEISVSEYLKLAEEGNVDYMFIMGHIFHTGIRVNIDRNRAVFWYEKAAKLGDVKAMNNLGILFLEGKGVPKNDSLAFT